MSKHSHNSFLGFALVAAVIGGAGAAVLAHPKGRQIKENLKDVGDDFADALERAIDKVHDPKKPQDDQVFDISNFVVTVVDELKQMNKAAEDTTHPPKQQFIQDFRAHVAEKVEEIEEKAEQTADEISQHIAWLEKQGKSLAKKGLREF